MAKTNRKERLPKVTMIRGSIGSRRRKGTRFHMSSAELSRGA